MARNARKSAPMRTLTEKAYQCIKEGIVRGEIEEGVLLSEKEFMRLESSVLERTRRLAYNVARSIGVQRQEMSLQNLHRPVVDAIRRGDRAAARQAIIHDIQQAQTILVGLGGRDLGETDGVPRRLSSNAKPAEPVSRKHHK